MPHIWVEYSSNLEDSIDVSALLKTTQDALIGDGTIFPFAGARTRGVPVQNYLIVDGHADNSFVHVLLRIAVGRSQEDRKAAASRVFEAVKDFLAPITASRPLGISVQMEEADEATNFKTSNYREYLKQRGIPEKASSKPERPAKTPGRSAPLRQAAGASISERVSAEPRQKTLDADHSSTRVRIRHFSKSLPMSLLRAREAVMRHFRASLRRFEITEQQWRVLRALTSVETIEVTTLADVTFLLPPSLSRILKDLDERGLIVRRTSSSDMRRGIISISPQGLELIERAGAESEVIYREITGRYGPERLAELQNLLQQLEECLDGPEIAG
ncbi:homoprotocatechuate degradation operon regulator HpaR [Microvirga sp. 17 mud 1-3]|uniref:homoprotocatechuate degradation operon regulator HpaR n=1 Tax=Microvirga sp. 17 mud 1-3 TaxID=2082949 RepID=UPI000D6B49CD|nr:homoprotocatechuate degradation operon regulator HpaR [Microvirga sp. 17 mud 1-3]